MDLRHDLLALQLAHGLFQQAHVRVEADRVDVPVLLAAQQIAGAAQLQIERGDLEAGAQVAEFLERRQPLARDLGQLRVGLEPADRRRRAGSTGPRARAS